MAMILIYVIFEVNLPYISFWLNYFSGYMLYHQAVVFVKDKDCSYVQPGRSSSANKYTKLQHRPCPVSANHQWPHLSVLSAVICHLKPSLHGNLIYRMRFSSAMKWRFNIDNYTGSSLFKLWLVNSSLSSLISEWAPSTLIFPAHGGKSIILIDSGINSWVLCFFCVCFLEPTLTLVSVTIFFTTYQYIDLN